VKKVEASEILDNGTYETLREGLRREAMAAKRARRVHVGDHLTFLFETRETVRSQVQEMLRIEGRSSPEDVQHELDTYNELLGDDGELGCTLLVEIEDETERARKLREWLPLVDHLYALLPDGTRVPATYDARQIGEDRLSAVQYLKFRCGAEAPVALGVDMPEPRLAHETALTGEQRGALQADLGVGSAR
jgi:hypothetical protein